MRLLAYAILSMLVCMIKITLKIVPMNFGYEIKDNQLLVYVHTYTEGYKLQLLAKNPRACLSFSKFQNFPDRPYKELLHDYRSVMVFGIMRMIYFKY